MAKQWQHSEQCLPLRPYSLSFILMAFCPPSAKFQQWLSHPCISRTLECKWPYIWVQELNALINMHLKSSPSNKRERDSPCVCVLIDGGENRNHKPGQGGILYYNIEPLEFKESGLRMITFHYMCGSLMWTPVTKCYAHSTQDFINISVGTWVSRSWMRSNQ